MKEENSHSRSGHMPIRSDLALAPGNPHAPTWAQKALRDTPYPPPEPNPPLQKLAQYIHCAQLSHDKRDGVLRRSERSHRREQRAHERRVIDAVHDEEHVGRVGADVDLAERGESPVEGRHGDGGG